MGKPRMIILVRHAQSEGNKNRDIHQFIPDHRVKLTNHGRTQAEEAGRQLRTLLKPDDTLQFFTSPYRRTRETTESILKTLTSDDPSPSPFPRHKIKVFEEPRLREQDFGNFQPCSAEMERMWQERADYGHFFYRIPDGESAADAYDRVSGFNESLWRQFGEPNFPSVCVLVTHGLMSRVFLMKWYHWSVEYFEDLRNVNHCEFIVMKQNPANGKYILENELRTWSDLKRRAASSSSITGSATGTKATPTSATSKSSPAIPTRRWGGCANGCNHDKVNWPRRVMRKNTADFKIDLPPLTQVSAEMQKDVHSAIQPNVELIPVIKEPSRRPSSRVSPIHVTPLSPISPNDASDDASSSDKDPPQTDGHQELSLRNAHAMTFKATPANAALQFRGSLSPGTPRDGQSDDSDYFPGMQHIHHHHNTASLRPKTRESTVKLTQQSRDRKMVRKLTEQSWREESGMGKGKRADTLGDGSDGDEPSDVITTPQEDDPSQASHVSMQREPEWPILVEALKGDMIVENLEENRANGKTALDMLVAEKKVDAKDIEKLKESDRKTLSEIY